MKTMRDRTKESNGLSAAATGNLFSDRSSWLRLPQGSREVEISHHFPDHYGTVTMMVSPAGGTGRNGFHIS